MQRLATLPSRYLPVWVMASIFLCFDLGVAAAQTSVVIDTKARRFTGGVGTLDREQYFVYTETIVPPTNTNLGNLLEQTYSPTGLNTATGRASTELDQLISQNLPEDPSRPGFFEPNALVNKIQGDYRNFVLSGSRWKPIREHENPIFVQSGRNGGFFPDFIDSGEKMPTNFAGYADFLKTYLREAVYGPNAFLPVNSDRFYLEIMNEPNFTPVPWANVIEMHQVVTEIVKEEFPQAKVGGASCCDTFANGSSDSWSLVRDLMDDMVSWETSAGQSVEVDFWSIHPYERYDIRADGSFFRRIDNSPGHVAGTLDLYESYSFEKFGDPKAFAITEYGSWNRPENGVSGYGNYARDEQQWDLARDTKEKLMVFMDRPDRIINAVPFIAPKHFSNQTPTPESADNVFFEQDASGVFSETILGNMYRMFAPVSGEYLGIEVGDPDLQSVAFRDGNDVYVMLNNLRSATQDVNLQALTGLGNVTSASWSRIFRDGSGNRFEQDVDVSGSWESLSLESEAGAVLKLTLDGPELYDHAIDTDTYYGDDTELAVSTQTLFGVDVQAELENAVSAKLRIGYSGSDTGLPTLVVRVNNNAFTITGDELAKDDGDDDLVTREIDVPISMLQEGANDIDFFFPFAGYSGRISAVVLEVGRTVGDYDGSGLLDAGDLDSLYQQFGAVGSDDRRDLNGDGVLDIADVNAWNETLRGSSAGDTDVDGDIDTRDAVVALARLGSGASVAAWTHGNFDGDNDVDVADVSTILNGFTGAEESSITGPLDVGVSADNPDLIYDSETGSLQIDTDGLSIVAFHLGTEAGFEASADFTDLAEGILGVSSMVDNTATDIGWVSPGASLGLGYSSATVVQLGALLPTGLDAAGLANFFSDASWAGSGVGGAFDLLILAAGLAGDFNADGVVDAADYTVWRATLGSAVDLRADANDDLVVNELDYLIWRNNFGATDASGSAAATVPEPNSFLLVLAAFASVALSHRENRNY